MNKSELKQLIKEEVVKILQEESERSRQIYLESIGEQHTNEVNDIINRLTKIKSELSNPEYVGWGITDIERIIEKSVKELGKLPRLIKNNTSK